MNKPSASAMEKARPMGKEEAMTQPLSDETMTDKAREIEPCPFCGKQAEIERDSDHHGSWFNLGCSDHWGKRDDGKHCIAGRMFYTESERTEDECIALWNGRATITSLRSDLAKAREALTTLRDAKWTDDLTRDIAIKALAPAESGE